MRGALRSRGRRVTLDLGTDGPPLALVCYGESGRPLLYVPSSGGDEGEFARYGMTEAVAPWVDAGRLQVVAIDGRAPATLWNDALGPPERIRAYAAFERGVRQRVIPWLLERAGSDTGLAVVGASYGGFVAANLWLKLPREVVLACGLGGVFGLWHRLDGHHDDVVYFHTPLEFLPRLHDPATLAALRAGAGMDLYAAADDEWLDSSLRLARLLRERDLPARLDVWPSPADHHERWWRLQLRSFLERRLGPA